MKKLKGHVAINEENKAFYISEENSVELTILRVLEGEKFMVIDLSKVDDSAISHIEKIKGVTQ